MKLLAIILIISINLMADEKQRVIMHKVFGEFVSLEGPITSFEEFSNEKNKALIQTKVKNIKSLVNEIKNNKNFKGLGFQISGNILSEHLDQFEKVFDHGNKNFAFWMLRSTLNICSSCHVQVSKKINFDFYKSNKNSFMSAEFLFGTRQYDEALKTYRHLISGYPENKLSSDNLETSFRKKLTIFVRIKSQFPQAIKEFEADLNNKKIPEFINVDLKNWVEDLKKLKVYKTIDEKTISEIFKTLIDKQKIDNMGLHSRDVFNLYYSGILYDYLNEKPNIKLVPEVLYNLALLDQKLNNEFFYSLSDLYLKYCVINYPGSPQAKDCYSEYENSIKLAYTGSSGTQLPTEVIKELKTLKSLLTDTKINP